MVKYIIEFENSELNIEFEDPTYVGTYDFNINSLLEGEESFRPLNFMFKLKKEHLIYSNDIQAFYNRIYQNLNTSKINKIKVLYISDNKEEYEMFNSDNYSNYNLIHNLRNVVYVNKYNESSADYMILHRIAFELKK